MVVSDPTVLYRVLFNLGDNALKYSDGPVSLAARVSDGTVRIDVRDRGVGIAAEDLPSVFDRFRQLEERAPVAPGSASACTCRAVSRPRWAVGSTP